MYVCMYGCMYGALTEGVHAMADSSIVYEPRIMNRLPGVNPCMYMYVYIHTYLYDRREGDFDAPRS
jgi:hypothetical protein